MMMAASTGSPVVQQTLDLMAQKDKLEATLTSLEDTLKSVPIPATP
jgi:hypothetical protein